jgi:hypothetical protein
MAITTKSETVLETAGITSGDVASRLEGNIGNNLVILNTDKDISISSYQQTTEQRYYITEVSSKSSGVIDGELQFKSGDLNGADSRLRWDKDTGTFIIDGTIWAENLNVTNFNLANFSPNSISLDIGSFYLQGGNAGEYLRTDGSGHLSWQPLVLAPAGANYDIQFNYDGRLASDSGVFVYDPVIGRMSVPNIAISGTVLGNLRPESSNTFNLGSAGRRWNTLWTGNYIHMGASNIEVKSTTGNKTNDDVHFLINNAEVFHLVSGPNSAIYEYPEFNSTIYLKDESDPSLSLPVTVNNQNTYITNAYLSTQAYADEIMIENVFINANTITTRAGEANLTLTVSENGTIRMGSNIALFNPDSPNTKYSVNLVNSFNTDLGTVSNLHISGGGNRQVLKTDGAGNLYWANTAAGANTHIQFSEQGNLQGSPALTFDYVNNVVTLTGDFVTETAIGDVITSNNFQLGNSTQILSRSQWLDATTVSSAANQVLYEIDSSLVTSVDFHVTATEGTNARQISKLLAINFDTQTNYQEYGETHVGYKIGELSIDQSAGNVRLLVSPNVSYLVRYNLIMTIYY